MTTSPAADRLRRRAVALTHLARLLQRCQALDVHLAAGTDTWVGPSPQACLDDLRMRRRQLLDHADALTSEGRRFLRIADELDARAAATPGAR
jgi:hypothetical protein